MAHAFKKAEAEWDSMKIDWMAAQSKRIKLEVLLMIVRGACATVM